MSRIDIDWMKKVGDTGNFSQKKCFFTVYCLFHLFYISVIVLYIHFPAVNKIIFKKYAFIFFSLFAVYEADTVRVFFHLLPLLDFCLFLILLAEWCTECDLMDEQCFPGLSNLRMLEFWSISGSSAHEKLSRSKPHGWTAAPPHNLNTA